ncbi:unnamed protein product [Lupinus luteus]|uniref:Uncharacterized protein n=1 Tax=Lupinus luteus TaxID=3873 RepID=A0AAV1VV78_LUPLU
MGCCVISNEKSNISLLPKDLEEETLKEVLSETPKWNPTVPIFDPDLKTVAKFDAENPLQKPTVAKFDAENPLQKPTVAKFDAENPLQKPTVAKFDAENPLQKPTVAKFDAENPLQKPTVAKFNAENPLQKPTVAKFEGDRKVEKVITPLEITKGDEEISEVCSLSETEQEPCQRVHSSPATINKNCPFSGEFGGGGGKSPARRTDQSPSRRNVRVVQSRECQMGNGVMRNQPRRDNSFRRSMLPASRGDNMAPRSVVGRSPSVRRTNQSPDRLRTTAPENDGRKREIPAMEQSVKESLENPLVSLECFIFL